MMFLTKYQVTYIINPSMQKIDMTKCEGKRYREAASCFFSISCSYRVEFPKKITGYGYVFDSTWLSSLFIKFEFHRISKCRVWTCIEFKTYWFFEFELFFARVIQVSQVLSSSRFMKIKIIELEFGRAWVFKFSSSVQLELNIKLDLILRYNPIHP